MSHQFVAFLCCGIQADGIVYLVICRVGHFLVAAIDAARTGIDQMFYTCLSVVVTMAASLQDVVETDEVRGNVSIGISNTVAYTCLGS